MTRVNRNNVMLNIGHTLIGIGLLHLHAIHLSRVFENETKYSHLSRIERETLFTSEYALYYSYYKTIASAPTFIDGFNQLINNNLTEYPNTINVFKSFHILPELAIGVIYREFMNITRYFGIHNLYCWAETRDDDSDYIFACDGLGDPMFFYLEYVWYMGGITVLLLYLYAAHLSRNIFGGLAAVAYFFCIHNDATRIHKTPAARENFALPFIIWQMFYLTKCIEKQNKLYDENAITANKRSFMVLKLTILTLIANLSWQFSSFIFVTQTFIMLFLFELDVIKSRFFIEYAIAHFMANSMANVLTFDNRHFVLCLQNPILLIILIYISKYKLKREILSGSWQQLSPRLVSMLHWLYSNITLMVVIVILLEDFIERLELTRQNDDVNSIYWNILMAKLQISPASFDTMLYLCNNELSFIDWHTVTIYNKLFASKIIAIFIIIHLSKWLQYRRKTKEITEDDIERAKNYLIEDFLEENKITMKDLLDSQTDSELKLSMERLKDCGYNYEKYRQEKLKNVKNKFNERRAFLDDVKKFKEEISNKNESNTKSTSHIESMNGNGGKATNVKSDDNDTESSVKNEKIDENIDSNDENNEMKTKGKKTENEKEKIVEFGEFVKAHYLYNILQTSVFLLMTCFVVKLKFVLSPFLCLMASTFPPKSWFNKAYHLYWFIYVVSVLFSIADTGIGNIQKQYQPKEYDYNEDFTNLIHWINKHTNENAVFASPSSIITTVMLSTKRPIVNHQRNEFHSMRTRTRLVYSILSKKPHNIIYSQLAKLKAEYVILSYKDCFFYENNCKISDIWDYVEPEYKDNVQFCAELFLKNVSSFAKVFINEKYLVLKIFSHSVELEFQNGLKEMQM